ncbi:unnamed protein product [Peniophora sp. CBMAI 1063]|nr:unnamed protein product [Peniophora sp. CBMAI 1063]
MQSAGYDGLPVSPLTMATIMDDSHPMDRLTVPTFVPRHPLPSPGPYATFMPEPAPPMPSLRSSYDTSFYHPTSQSQPRSLGASDAGHFNLPGGNEYRMPNQIPSHGMAQPAYGWRPEQVGHPMQGPPPPPPQHAPNYGPHGSPYANQPQSLPTLGRTPSTRSTAANSRPHSIASGLAATTGMSSYIAYGEPVPGSSSAPELASRAPPSTIVSSTKKGRERHDPNECRLQGCRQRVGYYPGLGGLIEWCSVEHMSAGMHQRDSKPCKRCKVNPRRWDNDFCCNACMGFQGGRS